MIKMVLQRNNANPPASGLRGQGLLSPSDSFGHGLRSIQSAAGTRGLRALADRLGTCGVGMPKTAF